MLGYLGDTTDGGSWDSPQWVFSSLEEAQVLFDELDPIAEFDTESQTRGGRNRMRDVRFVIVLIEVELDDDGEIVEYGDCISHKACDYDDYVAWLIENDK